MTKADIIEEIAKSTGLTKSDIAVVANQFITTIIDGLKQNKHIELRGFGSFDVKKRAQRVARNPKSGEQVIVPQRNVPVFKPSKELKVLIANNQ